MNRNSNLLETARAPRIFGSSCDALVGVSKAGRTVPKRLPRAKANRAPQTALARAPLAAGCRTRRPAAVFAFNHREGVLAMVSVLAVGALLPIFGGQARML